MLRLHRRIAPLWLLFSPAAIPEIEAAAWAAPRGGQRRDRRHALHVPPL